MSFTIFDILYWMLIILNYFFITKALTQDWRFHLKESIYVVVASLLIVIAIVSGIVATSTTSTLSAFAIPFFIFFYFYQIKSYSAKKAISLTLFAVLIANLFEFLCITVSNLLFPHYLTSLPNFPFYLTFSFHDFLFGLPYIFSLFLSSIAATVLLVLFSKKLRKTINQSRRAQTALAVISISLLAFILLTTIILQDQNAFYAFVLSFEPLFLLGFLITILVSFYFYVRSEREKMILRQKEAEQKIQQEYTEHIEAQQTGMRKFKHDYKNILLSVDGFVAEEDWEGLKQYMPKVKAASSIITKDEFALENLSKIKSPEIKGLLAAKLMLAQNINIDIHTTFEADSEIDHVSADSVALVRMLGIIMDNAIEELQALGGGQLSVACFKAGNAVNFVVKNTCRPDLPSIRQLSQSGFSTKGENRGLGLSNLSELANATPNVALQTNVVDGNFIQRLIVGEEL